MKKLLFIILMIACHAVQADNWYRVELIVFEQLSPNSGGEVWHKFPGLPDTTLSETVIAVDTSSESNYVAFQRLKPELLTLSGTFSTLKKSSQYRPLAYQAWMQPSRLSRPVKVAINNPSDDLVVLGNATVRSGVYLFIDLDLAYSITGASLVNQEQAVKTTRLTESRRVKLNEIHYFDHPLFGAIVRVVRLNNKQDN